MARTKLLKSNITENIAPVTATQVASSKPKCQGKTKTGTACKKFAVENQCFCKVHSQPTTVFYPSLILDAYDDVSEDAATKIVTKLEELVKNILTNIQVTTRAINKASVQTYFDGQPSLIGTDNYAVNVLQPVKTILTKMNSAMNQIRPKKLTLGKEAKDEMIKRMAEVLQRELSIL